MSKQSSMLRGMVSSQASLLRGDASLSGVDEGPALLYRDESLRAASMPRNGHQEWGSQSGVPAVQEVSSIVEAPPDAAANQPVEQPSEKDFHEIVGLLKVKTSMLALGACERVKRLSKAYPQDVCLSPVPAELVHILEEGPGTPLAAAALSALSTLALTPAGRQRIVLLGGATPIIKLVTRCDLSRPNTARAVQLLMNLAADAQNRRVIRESGGVEALVALMRVAPLEAIMEQAMGALHNVMLTDSKAKTRAVDAGVAYGLARVLSQKYDEGHALAVRSRMLLSDLLRVQDMQQRIVEAAKEQGLRIPGMMAPAGRETSRQSSVSTVEHAGLQRLSTVGVARLSNIGDHRVSIVGDTGSVLSPTAPSPSTASVQG